MAFYRVKLGFDWNFLKMWILQEAPLSKNGWSQVNILLGLFFLHMYVTFGETRIFFEKNFLLLAKTLCAATTYQVDTIGLSKIS